LENASSGDVMNVSGGAPAALTAGSGSPLPNTPGTSLADQATELRSNLNDLSSRADDAMRASENLLAQNTASSSFLSDSRGANSGTGTGKFSSTATQPAMPPAGSNSGPLSGTQPSGLTGPTLPNGNYATSPIPSYPSASGATSNPGINAPSGRNSAPGNTGIAGNLGNPQYAGGAASQGAGTQPYSNSNNAYTGTAPGFNNAPGYAGSPTNSGTPGYTANPGYSANPSYTSNQGYTTNPGYGMTPTNNGNFGSVPRGTPSQEVYNQYATAGTGLGTQYQPQYQPQYQASGSPPPVYSGFPSDPLALPSLDHRPTRIADNRSATSVPSTGGGTSANGATGTRSGSAGDTAKGRASEPNTDSGLTDPYGNRSGMENILPVMFVLSLVVNFYLGMLIRKLLGRYRSLLSSVRGQAV
jgi:hypothetical protein